MPLDTFPYIELADMMGLLSPDLWRVTLTNLCLNTMHNLFINVPSGDFMQALINIQDIFKDSFFRRRAPQKPWSILLLVTACLTLLRIRLASTCGRRQYLLSAEATRGFKHGIQLALRRRGEATYENVSMLVELFRLQLRCIFGLEVGNHYIYQVGFRGLYVGQGRMVRTTTHVPGALYRFKEHYAGLFGPAKTLTTKNDSNLSRYTVLRKDKR